jgi:hypothetical protein
MADPEGLNHAPSFIPREELQNKSVMQWILDDLNQKIINYSSMSSYANNNRAPKTTVKRVRSLILFFVENGHWKIPFRLPDGKVNPLNSFASTVRAARKYYLSNDEWDNSKKGDLGKWKNDAWPYLEAVGFPFNDQHDEVFLQNLEKLKIFKGEYGHTQVPQHYAHDPQLGQWVHRMRKNINNGEEKYLPGTMYRGLLDEVGFESVLGRGNYRRRAPIPTIHRNRIITLTQAQKHISILKRFHETYEHLYLPYPFMQGSCDNMLVQQTKSTYLFIRKVRRDYQCNNLPNDVIVSIIFI